jgi:hypothetical protein
MIFWPGLRAGRHHRGARAAHRTWRRLPLRRRLPENASHAVQFNGVFVSAVRHKNTHSLDGRLQAPVDW